MIAPLEWRAPSEEHERTWRSALPQVILIMTFLA